MNTALPQADEGTISTGLTTAMQSSINPVDAEVDAELSRIVPKQFCIEDAKTANWLVRRIIDARLYAERVKEWAEQEQRRAAREEKTLLFLFGRQIEAWARDEIRRMGGKGKSLSLPAGTIAFRHENPKLVIDDENAVLAWVRQNLPDAIQTTTTERLAKSILHQHFEETGELPEGGCHIEPARERFSIR